MFPQDKDLDKIPDFPKKLHNFLLRLHRDLPKLSETPASNVSCGDIAVVRGHPLLPLRRKTLVDTSIRKSSVPIGGDSWLTKRLVKSIKACAKSCDMSRVGEKEFRTERVLMDPPNHCCLNDYGFNVSKLQ